MKVKLQLSPRIIQNIASLYNDTNRILMEYIDNSIDSAEELFPEGKRNLYSDYPREVLINVEILGKKYTEGQIIITDNCNGIDDLRRIIQSLGSSNKRTQYWTNGQFGYGIFSFFACCESLKIITKYGHAIKYTIITRSKFDTDNIDDVHFEVEDYKEEFPLDSGTKIILDNFDKDKWKTINSGVLKNDIENHFELILKRKNIKINIKDKHGINRCNTINYNIFKGYEFSKEFKIKYKKTELIEGTHSKSDHEELIFIFLKFTEDVSLNRAPVFISKKRRIASVKDIRLFKSSNKSLIWSHPQITGYINVGSVLEPTIARTDFKNNEISKKLFDQLNKIEKEIYDTFKEMYENKTRANFTEIENQINIAFSSIHSKFIKVPSSNKIGSLVKFNNVTNSEKYLIMVNKPVLRTNRNRSLHKRNLYRILPNCRIKKNKDYDLIMKSIETTSEKNLINLKIDDTSSPPVDSNNEPVRSQLVNGTVIIYKNHIDFINRIDYARNGEERISHSLISYLCTEMILNFIKFKSSGIHTESMDITYADYFYKLEYTLRNIAGAKISLMS